MKRTTLWILLSFLLGMITTYGLYYLGHKASIPRIQSTAVFEVEMPDGTVKHLSYSEIERDREELKMLREKIRFQDARRDSAKDISKAQPRTPPQSAQEDKKPVAQAKAHTKPSSKNLSDLFTKLMNSNTMKELADEQVTREAGELAGVLSLTKDERTALEKVLGKHKKFPASARMTADKQPEETDTPESQKTLEEELRSLLPPEKYALYQEYTEKKKSLAGASSLDKEMFELSHRLALTDEQETSVREILKGQGEKAQSLSLSPAGDEEDLSPLERMQHYVDQKSAIDQETNQRMQQLLSPNQYAQFLEYQQERSTEVRIIKKLLEEASKSESSQ